MEQKEKKRKKKKNFRGGYYDYNLLAIVILLICFGLIMLYSTSAYEAQMKFHGDDMYYFRRQALISVGAIVIAILISKLDYHLMIPFTGALYVISLILMAMVRFSPFGVEAYGSRRWLKLGIQFQPSEIAKIAIITFLPVLIIKTGRKVRKLGTVAFLVLVGLIQAAGAFVLTDNLSTGIIIGGIAMVMIFIAHPKTKPFLVVAAIIGTIAGSIVAYMGLTMTTSEDFRIRRILAWLHPEANMSSGGYQALQGLYAIGSGGFFGKGLGNSAQKLGTIPEAQNDMIFSIVCEELGIFGAALLLLMFGYLLYRLFFIAQNAPDLYGTLVVAGIFVHIALQVILNLCVVLNLMPTTGITLPFVSYGGTSILFLMTEMGIALSVSGQIRTTEAEREEMMEVETQQ